MSDKTAQQDSQGRFNKYKSAPVPTADPIFSAVRFRGEVFLPADKKPLFNSGKWLWGMELLSDMITRDSEDWHWNLPMEFHAFMTGAFTYPQLRYYNSEKEALKDFYQAYRFAVMHYPDNVVSDGS